MNILYSGDRNTRLGILLSALSLCENTNENINVYILTATAKKGSSSTVGIEPQFALYLDSVLKRENPDNSACLIDISRAFEEEFPEMNKNTRFTPSCMLRLFADTADLPEKVLYLDYDVLCLRDFSEFYNTDLDGVELAGALDYYGRFFYSPRYINSGVLLLNMAEIKRTGLFAMCRRLCRKKRMLLPDQSSLNRLSREKFIVDRRYNEQKKTAESTVFRHFSTTFKFLPVFRKVSVKPWDKERMHSVLGIRDHDKIIDKALTLFNDYQGETNDNHTHFLCG